jgi:GH25 family lysozyme M1 (1,4-beta-N-acetylmuramidase)
MKTSFAAKVLSSFALVAGVGCSASVDTNADGGATSDEARVCAAGPTVEGIDVSVHQERVDWPKVKASGRAFAFARVSDGLRHVDERFAENWAGIKSVGMVRGAYQFFRPGQNALEQADLMVRSVGALGPGDLPAVLDIESSDGQSSATIVAGMRTWLRRVKEGTGKDPIIYAAVGFWDTLSGTSEFAANTLWVANYQVSCPFVPDTWPNWTFWQYADTGSVPGVDGNTDVNRFNGTLEQLLAFANGGGAGGPSGERYCPPGSAFDAGARLCLKDGGATALGPFTAAMVATCQQQGGGEPCLGDAWEANFAKSIRGTGACPPGASFDAGSQACVEGDSAFGPFSPAQVERCRQFGGGPACETMRWAKSFVGN